MPTGAYDCHQVWYDKQKIDEVMLDLSTVTETLGGQNVARAVRNRRPFIGSHYASSLPALRLSVTRVERWTLEVT
jgi:hypothetical protein